MWGRRAYDLVYRWGAPWETGPREELRSLVRSGRLTPRTLPPGRAVDLGCGSGANAIFLAEAGFSVTGIDFSAVALAKARTEASRRGLANRARFVQADLTAPSIEGVDGPFDLLVDYSTLDDLRAQGRAAMASTVGRLSRSGSAYLLWCFYRPVGEVPLFSLRGPSRLFAPPLQPGEEQTLFGEEFVIERLPEPGPERGAAAFLMTRR